LDFGHFALGHLLDPFGGLFVEVDGAFFLFGVAVVGEAFVAVDGYLGGAAGGALEFTSFCGRWNV
jgi:hypothetical protein